jgi:hydroxymethylglutaryl-CoA reductase
VHLRILSNLADRRMARARCTIPLENWPSAKDSAAKTCAMALSLPGRSPPPTPTAHHPQQRHYERHRPVVIATATTGAPSKPVRMLCRSQRALHLLSTWGKDAAGNLVGTLEMPMAVGIVGGATRVHPAARRLLKLMGVHQRPSWLRSSSRWGWLKTWLPCAPWLPKASSAAI